MVAAPHDEDQAHDHRQCYGVVDEAPYVRGLEGSTAKEYTAEPTSTSMKKSCQPIRLRVFASMLDDHRLHHSFMHHDGGMAAAGVVSSMCVYIATAAPLF